MVSSKNEKYTEMGRKVLHIAMVIFAFLLRYISWEMAMALAIAALLHNLFIMPRLTQKFYREGTPMDIGIIFYPLSVFLVILFFPNDMYLAAALWAIMSFGDGFATIFGIKFGRKKLPWSSDKSWAGTAAYLIFGSLGAALLIWWTLHPLAEGKSPLFYYLVLPVVLTFISAIFESLPFGVNDNLLVPLTGAFAGYIILKMHPFIYKPDWGLFKEQLLYGFIITAAVGIVSFLLRFVSTAGAVGGIIAGTLLYAFAGWEGFVLLIAFFIIASALTKLGYRIKEQRGLAQEDKGARGAKHVIANVSLAIIIAVLWFITSNPILVAAFAASFAAALSDTSSTEIGQLWGKRSFLITTFKRVKPGTDGAISAEGTIAGLMGSFIIGFTALATGFVNNVWLAVIIGASGFLGNIVESYMNALIRNKSKADNELMNFLNTITGAGIVILLYNLFF